MTLTPHVELFGILVDSLSKRLVFGVNTIEQLALLLANYEMVLLDFWDGLEDLVAEPGDHDDQLREEERPFEQEAKMLRNEWLADKCRSLRPRLPVVPVRCSVPKSCIGLSSWSSRWRLHRWRGDSWTLTHGTRLLICCTLNIFLLISMYICIVIAKISKIDNVDYVIIVAWPRLTFLGHWNLRFLVHRLNCLNFYYLLRLVGLLNYHRYLLRYLGNLRPVVGVLIQNVGNLRLDGHWYFLNDRVWLRVILVHNGLFFICGDIFLLLLLQPVERLLILKS